MRIKLFILFTFLFSVSTTMLKHGAYLTNTKQLQLRLIQEQKLLSGLQDRYDLLEKNFGCEPLPESVGKTTGYHKGHRNKKHNLK